MREFREQKGWSKSEIARQLGISSQLYGHYEDQKRTPKGDFFLKWREVFGEDLLEKIVSNEDESAYPAASHQTLAETALINARSIDRLSDIVAEQLSLMKQIIGQTLLGHPGTTVGRKGRFESFEGKNKNPGIHQGTDQKTDK